MNRPFLALCALLCFSSTSSAQHLELYVSGEDSWSPAVLANDDFDRGSTWPMPMVTRSQAVTRALVTDDGIGLRIFSAGEYRRVTGVSITAVPHSFEQQVLIVDGSPAIVGAPELVSNDPSIARLDMAFGPKLNTKITAREGKSLLGIEGKSSVRAASSLRPGSILAGTFDQIFAAEVTGIQQAGQSSLAKPTNLGAARLVDVHSRKVLPLSFPSPMSHGPVVMEGELVIELPTDEGSFKDRVIGRGRCLELWVEEPSFTNAEAWTLLVSVSSVTTEGDFSIPAPWSEPETRAWDGFPLFDDASLLLDGGVSHLEGPAEQLDIRPTMGPGAAWGDVDGDGYMDLYLAQGGGRDVEQEATPELGEGEEAPAPKPQVVPATASLFRFLPASGTLLERFDRVWPSGLEVPAKGMGPLFFDADGDGDVDLYQANMGTDGLFENRWSESINTLGEPFRALDKAAFPAEITTGWSAGVAAGDVDLDGDLDLYVTTYLIYDESLMPDDGEGERYLREDPIAMLPFSFPGGRNYLLLNDSGEPRAGASKDAAIHFRDGTEEYGVADEEGRGMQPVFWDFDRDGDVDLYVANDVSYNKLWRNEKLVKRDGAGTDTYDTEAGPGGFKDVSFSSGMDDPRGGMGLAIGDLERDGDQDLFLSNWQLDANGLYRNNLLSHRSQKTRVATFRDVIVQSGLAKYGVGYTSWGVSLFDADCDTDLDLFVSNGYTSPDYEQTGICVGQPNHFFRNVGKSRFVDASDEAGPAVTIELPSRTAIAVDYDQDGDLDLVVTTNNGPVQLLRNQHRQQGKAGHWLNVRLNGKGKNTFGIGAEVTIHASNSITGETIQLRRSLLAGVSYLGGNPAELFFGLGEFDEIPLIEIRWPSGALTTHGPGPTDRVIRLVEDRK
jgi:hypothetical protein